MPAHSSRPLCFKFHVFSPRVVSMLYLNRNYIAKDYSEDMEKNRFCKFEGFYSQLRMK